MSELSFANTEETVEIPARAILLTDTTRDFFAPIMPELIPDDAHILMWSREGYMFLTEAEWSEAKPVNEQPRTFTFNMPHMMMFTYYDALAEI